jgi:Protein of unknown function (DUF2510)
VSLETMIVVWLFCGAVTAAIGHAKNRNVGESFLWGALLGVIGVIVVLCLSKNPGAAPKPGWYPDPADSGGQRYWNGGEWSDLPPRPKPAPAGKATTVKCVKCQHTQRAPLSASTFRCEKCNAKLTRA